MRRRVRSQIRFLLSLLALFGLEGPDGFDSACMCHIVVSMQLPLCWECLATVRN